MALPNFGQIEAYRGDGLVLPVTFEDAAGKAINIAGYALVFTAKASDTDDDAEALVSRAGTIVDEDAGEAQIDLTEADLDIDPGSYPADIEVTPASGRRYSIRGKLVIAQDVRRGT